ncbi:uncharacterized protein LOC132983565 [Labrus mixtus]|uniref:uncharacterized protein LOC132983565 n=1 Tax=Labrus mixtus TaxID=508554 RepID=UPI0029C011E3|nr:uncharacterized protein LOC132983565 [Labrus mixtus]
MMNLVRNKSLHPHLRDDEAHVVENAIRLAIDSIMNVIYGVNSATTHEHKRMVADRDKEIQRLERKVREAEHELKVQRRQGCSCMLFENEHGLARGAQSSGDPREREQSGFEPSCMDPEMTAGQQECAMSISLGLFARPASHVSSQSHESALLSSPSGTGPDQTCTSHSSESPGVSDAGRNLPTSPSSSGLVIKEEPCDIDTVLIKWEMNEERIMDGGETTSSLCQEKESPSAKKQLENRGLREKAHTDSGGHSLAEGEHLRNKKKNVPMSELPEEVQKVKRAAWRAASRRYYARKVARQQANPLRPAPLRPPHIMDSHYSQPISFAGRRRKALISESPGDTQTQQREAWRAASRRYYARKITRHQTDPSQFRLQNMEPTGETLAPSRGESHTNTGGIMCSRRGFTFR